MIYRPEISDKEWDDMYFELQKLERESGIYLEDSPTQKVNFQVVNKLNKVEHNHPMLSLDKTKDIKEIQKFVYNNDYIVFDKKMNYQYYDEYNSVKSNN